MRLCNIRFCFSTRFYFPAGGSSIKASSVTPATAAQVLAPAKMSSEANSTQQSVQGTAEQQGQQFAEPSQAHPKGTLEDLDTNELDEKRNQILWEQAVKGQQPGLTLMQDGLSWEQ